MKALIVAAVLTGALAQAATHYLAPTGSDSAPGTYAQPWKTPNHSGLVCGDVLMAKRGTYSEADFSGTFVLPQCSAASDVAWLKCEKFGYCRVDSMRVNANQWGVQGWNVQMGVIFVTTAAAPPPPAIPPPPAPAPLGFDVQNYGARGDGSTDDTKAIQSAIDAARAAGGGTVLFPASGGCYRTTGLTLYSGSEYIGKDGSVCIESIGESYPIVQTPAGSAFSDARIASLKFMGSNTRASGAPCLHLAGPTNVIVDRVVTAGCAGDGFYITGYGTNRVNPGDGLLVTDSRASYSGRNGMSIITGKNITVRNSVFEYSGKGAPYDGVDIEPNNASQQVENVTFENCKFLNNGKPGSTASGHNGFNVWETFANLPKLNLRLIDCEFSGNLRDGLYAAGSSGNRLTGIYLIGGSMSNNQAQAGYRGGVDIWNADSIVVSGMNISVPASTGQAVFLWGVNGAAITNSILSAGGTDINANSSTGVKVYSSTRLVEGTRAGAYTMASGTAPTILTASVPQGGYGQYYSTLLTATGDAPIAWNLVPATGNSLPSGVTFGGDGLLRGTPVQRGVFTFSVSAGNGFALDQKTFTITVN